MKRKYLVTVFFLVLMGVIYVSCGPTVTVKTPEPIEINVNVRIDIYNHVAAVEESIYGDVEKPEEGKQSPSGGESLFRGIFMQGAFGAASDDDYNAALQSRKARASKVIQYKNEGSLGENHNGLVSLIQSDKVKSDSSYADAVKKLIKEENADREKMYAVDAAKKGVSLDVIKDSAALYHRDSSKKGWWIEVLSGGKWVWQQK